MGRKPKDNDGQSKPWSRFKRLCEKLRIDHDHLSMIEFAEKLGSGYMQPRLSQFETRPEGPPLDIVEQYADFFKLKGNDRIDFFLAALQSSGQIRIDQNKLPLGIQEGLFKLIAIFLSNRTLGEIISKMKIDPSYGIQDPEKKYINLKDEWRKVEYAIENFALQGAKSYNLLPEPAQANGENCP